MTLGYIFPTVSLLVVFVPTAGSSLGQGQCLITGRTLSKALQWGKLPKKLVEQLRYSANHSPCVSQPHPEWWFDVD